jgi:hypothetical protein
MRIKDKFELKNIKGKNYRSSKTFVGFPSWSKAFETGGPRTSSSISACLVERLSTQTCDYKKIIRGININILTISKQILSALSKMISQHIGIRLWNWKHYSSQKFLCVCIWHSDRKRWKLIMWYNSLCDKIE